MRKAIAAFAAMAAMATGIFSVSATPENTSGGQGGWDGQYELVNFKKPVWEPTGKPRPRPTATTTAPVARTSSLGTGGTWYTRFGDDFNNGSLDTNKWRPNYYGASDTSITKGANSAEDACMDPANVSVSNGALHLALTSSSVTCNSVTEAYRGAMIQSSTDGHNWTPSSCGGECYFEAVIKLPATSSYIKNWPAFWTNADYPNCGVGNGACWPQGGENDIMEVLCDACATPKADGEAVATYHYYDQSEWSEEPSSQTAFRDGNYHTYASQWSSDGTVRWYYDDVLIGSITGAETSMAHHIILANTAGTWGGPTSAATVDVDRVYVYGRTA